MFQNIPKISPVHRFLRGGPPPPPTLTDSSQKKSSSSAPSGAGAGLRTWPRANRWHHHWPHGELECELFAKNMWTLVCIMIQTRGDFPKQLINVIQTIVRITGRVRVFRKHTYTMVVIVIYDQWWRWLMIMTNDSWSCWRWYGDHLNRIHYQLLLLVTSSLWNSQCDVTTDNRVIM